MKEFRVGDLTPCGSEELLKSFFADAAIGLSITDLQGRFVKVNPAYCAITGYTEAELRARDFQSITHPDDLPRTVAKVAALLAGEISPFLIEKRYIRKDAIVVWVLNSVSVIRDQNGQATNLVRLSQDMTERMELEKSLRRAEVRTESILASISDVYMLFDHRWRYAYVNETAVRAIGRPRELILGRTLWELFPDIVGTELEREYRRAMDERVTVNFDSYYAARDNWWENRFYPVPAGLAVFATDVTERKRAEGSLKLFRSLLDRSTDAIEVIDPETLRFLDCNQSACQSLDYSREEFLALSVFDIDPCVNELRISAISEEMKRSGFAMFESIHRRKDGSTFPVEVNVKEIQLDRPYRLAVVRDITERKRAEEALRESEERFRQLSEAAFEAIVIHDQGTILEVNQSFCRMYGYERAEVIGKSVLDLALPEFREPLLQRVRSAGASPFEGLAVRKDGTIFRAELAAKPIHYQGRAVRVAAIRDITEQKRNERRQAAQYGVTRVLAESATLAEATPQLLRVICESLRWKIGEFWRVGDSPNLLRCVETWHVPALDATSFIEASRQTKLASGVGLPGRVWQSGQPAWVSDLMTDPGFASAAMAAKVGLRGAVAFPILLGTNTLGVMLFFSRRAPEVDEDLLKMMSAIGSQIGQFTERRRAEDALRDAVRKYRDIFENAGEGIFQSTPEGQYIAANPALARMHGFDSPEELIRSRRDITREIYVDPERRTEFKRLLEKQGAVRGFEHQIFRKDGSRIWVTVNARAVRDEQGRVLYYEGTSQDITERQRAETRSAAFASLARKLSGARSQLDAGRIIAKTAGDLFGWDACNLDLYDAERDEIHPMLNVDTIDGKQVDVTALVSNRPPTARSRRVIDNGPELILREEPVTFDPDSIPFGDTSRPCASLMSVPIRHVSKVIGLLSIQSYSLRAYDQSALSDLEALADHCGEALNRIRAEESFFESEERYRDLVENSREFICTHDLDGLILSANRAAADMLGYDLSDYCGQKNFRDILAPQVRDQFDDYLARIRRDGVASGLTLVQTNSGERRVWEYHNTLRTEGVDTPIVRGMARDITEERRAEKALRASEERYRELFENAKDALYVHDLGGRYRSFNRAAEQLSGYTREEIIGKHFSNFVAPRSLKDARKNLCRKLDEESETTYEIELITKDRRRVPVEVSSRLIHENGKPVGVQGVARDITDRKRAQEALRTYSQRLIEAQEAERQVIARELHDEIGQVLTAVRINLQSLQHLARTDSSLPPIDDSLVIVDEALEHVRELSLNLRPSVLDNLGLASALRWYVDRYARRSGIVADLRSDIEDGCRLRVELETACFRIVQEALTNVARHAQATHVSVRLTRSNGNLDLSIRDNGVGFVVSQLLNSSTPTSALGLRGMEERAVAVLGFLRIDSAPMRGTEVRAAFPLTDER